jgi:hypothetical protein
MLLRVVLVGCFAPCLVAALVGRDDQRHVPPPRRWRATTVTMGPIIKLARPLGITFEEVEPNKPLGVRVASLVPGGSADRDGRVFVGDALVAVSGVILVDEGRWTLGGSGFTNWSVRDMRARNQRTRAAIETYRSSAERGVARDSRGRAW